MANPMTKFIVHGPADELDYVHELIREAIPMFHRRPERIGWGWMFSRPGKPRYFIREIKGGLSATRDAPPKTASLKDTPAS